MIADKGYHQLEDMIECLEKGFIANVILPDGQETYELEIEYEEKEYDKYTSEHPFGTIKRAMGASCFSSYFSH